MNSLLPYQNAWIEDRSSVKVWEKSRRVGASFADAADSALVASRSADAGGMSTYYISYNKDMTAQYIRDVAHWAKEFHLAAAEAEEFVLRDGDRDITVYQVRFDSGFVVQALSSSPTNLRSKQGRVRIDEAAFVPDLGEVLKAALALIMWGGDIGVMSTHNGEDNEFNSLVQDIRAGKKPYSLHRCTLDDALAQGLYRRIVEVQAAKAIAQGRTPPAWSPETEAAWREGLIAQYGEDADEELFCIPSRGTGAYISRALYESCMSLDVPVIRWSPPAPDFVDWPLDTAYREVRDWCEAHLAPLLGRMPRDARSYLGEDFARNVDLTVIVPASELPDLVLRPPFVLELRGAPFRTQEQILFYAMDRMPRLSGAALDARGNGQALAEYARQRYGASRVSEVMISEGWYRENMPALKARLEDRTIILPQDAATLDDFRAVKLVRGVPRIPDIRGGDAEGKRHGDAAVAACMLVHAVKSITFEEWDVATAGSYATSQITRGYRI